MQETEVKYKIGVNEITEQHQQIKKLVFVSSERIKPGHLMHEINMLTGLIKTVEYKSVTIVPKFTKKDRKGRQRAYTSDKHYKVIMKDKCIYIPALNVANVLKVFERRHKKAYEFYKKHFIDINNETPENNG